MWPQRNSGAKKFLKINQKQQKKGLNRKTLNKPSNLMKITTLMIKTTFNFEMFFTRTRIKKLHLGNHIKAVISPINRIIRRMKILIMKRSSNSKGKKWWKIWTTLRYLINNLRITKKEWWNKYNLISKKVMVMKISILIKILREA